MNYIDTNTLEHNEIKTSPFAVYPGECIKPVPVPAPRSLYITELDKTILLLVNQYMLLSSKLLQRAMENAGVEMEQKVLQNRLNRLCDALFLQASRFVNSDGSTSVSKVYSVAYRGRGFLNSIGVQPRLTGYLARLDAQGVKRYLSVNQYLILTDQDPRFTEVGCPVLVPAPRSGKPDKIFRAYGMVRQWGRTLIVDSVRKGDNWQTETLERLDRMYATLKDKHCTPKMDGGVRLVLIAESEDHLKQLDALLRKRRYTGLSIQLSCDLKVYNDPENCLAERDAPVGFFRSLFVA